jgi:hypothetical protein
MKGSWDVETACARVFPSRMDAQLMSLLLMVSTLRLPLTIMVGPGTGGKSSRSAQML